MKLLHDYIKMINPKLVVLSANKSKFNCLTKWQKNLDFLVVNNLLTLIFKFDKIANKMRHSKFFFSMNTNVVFPHFRMYCLRPNKNNLLD